MRSLSWRIECAMSPPRRPRWSRMVPNCSRQSDRLCKFIMNSAVILVSPPRPLQRFALLLKLLGQQTDIGPALGGGQVHRLGVAPVQMIGEEEDLLAETFF